MVRLWVREAGEVATALGFGLEGPARDGRMCAGFLGFSGFLGFLRFRVEGLGWGPIFLALYFYFFGIFFCGGVVGSPYFHGKTSIFAMFPKKTPLFSLYILRAKTFIFI